MNTRKLTLNIQKLPLIIELERQGIKKEYVLKVNKENFNVYFPDNSNDFVI